MTRRHIATKLVRIFYYLRNNHIFLAEDGEIERLIPTVDGHGINWVERVFEEYPNLGDVIYDDAKHFIKMVFNIT